jgi:DNA polymerase-3 subunit epsilon
VRTQTAHSTDGIPGLEARLVCGWRPRVFVALDFETANRSPASACALAVVRVEGRKVVCCRANLVRPTTSEFEFSRIHGIRWADVSHQPSFPAVWQSMAELVKDAEFIAAHNAKFDQGVLRACCKYHRIPDPSRPFVCTVKLARQRWDLYPTKLPDVCDFLGLSLKHHDALSDASACAKIVLAAMGNPSRVGTVKR